MADVNADINVHIDTSQTIEQLKALRAEISRFHQSVIKSSAAASAAQLDLQTNLVNAVNATGKFHAKMGLVRTSTESFTHALETNKLSMRDYFRYAGGATTTFRKLFKQEFDTITQVAEDRVKRMQTQYVKLGRDASGAMKAISITPTTLDMKDYGTQAAVSAQRQALFNQLLKQGSTNLLNFGKNTQWAGRQLMVGFTVPLMYFGTAAGKVFMDLEEQTIKFKRVYGDMFTTTDEANRALGEIQALAKEFTKYGVSVSKTIEMAAQAAAMGKTGAELTAQVSEATRLSVLGSVEQAQALETTISLTNAFGIAAEDLRGKIDFLNVVENQTVLSIEDLTIAIPKAAPVIKQLGGSVEDLAFFMTAMKEGGINASEGANAIKSGLAALINPTKKASEMLAGFGINIKGIVEANKGNVKGLVVDFAKALDTLDPLNRARAIEQLFGKFQFSRLSTLFQNVSKDGTQAARVLDLTQNSVEELAILSERELKRVEDAVGTNFKASIEQLKVTIAPIGKEFLKAVTPIVKAVSGLLDKFNNLGDGTKKFIVIATALLGVIGPTLLMTFGLLLNSVANIIKFFGLMRNGFLKLSGNSTTLAEQTNYLTKEQMEATTVAAALDQAHNRLTQRFTSEAVALEQLRLALDKAVASQMRFAASNPNMIIPGSKKYNKGTVRVGKYADGAISIVPGSGNQDTVPAMLTPGEAVIPKDKAKQYAPLIQAIISGNLPGFRKGDPAVFVPGSYEQGHFGGSKQMSGAALLAAAESMSAKAQQMIQDLVNKVENGLTELFNVFDNRVVSLSHEVNSALGQSGSGKTVSAALVKRDLVDRGVVAHPQLQREMEKAGASIEEIDNAVEQITKEITTGFDSLGNATQVTGEQIDAIIAAAYEKIAQTNKKVDAAYQKMQEITTIADPTQRGGRAARLAIPGKQSYKQQREANTAEMVRSAARKNVEMPYSTVAQFNITEEMSKEIGASQVEIQKAFSKLSEDARQRLSLLKQDVKQFGPALLQALADEGIALQSAGKQMGESVIRGIAEGTKAASPSQAAMQQGENVGDGFEAGIINSIPEVKAAAERLAAAGIDPLNEPTKSIRFQHDASLLTDAMIVETALAKAQDERIKKVRQEEQISSDLIEQHNQERIQQEGQVRQAQQLTFDDLEQNIRRTNPVPTGGAGPGPVVVPPTGPVPTQSTAAQNAKNAGAMKAFYGKAMAATTGLTTLTMAASAMGGSVGEAAQKMMPFIFGLQGVMTVLPMLQSKTGALTVGIAAAAMAFMKLRQDFDNARKEMIELKNATTASAEAIQNYAEFSNKVTATEIADRKRSEKFKVLQNAPGKTTFGEAFVQTEKGKKTIEAFSKQIAQNKGAVGTSVSDLTTQLSTAVLSGALDMKQARSIAANIADEMGNMTFGLQVNAKLNELLGPNGENILKDGIQVRAKLIEQQQGNIARSAAGVKAAGGSFISNTKTGNAVGVGYAAGTGAIAGAAIGTLIPIPGATLVGAGIGAVVGAATAYFTLKKQAEQLGRRSGALIADMQGALTTQYQLSDALDESFKKRIAEAKAAGDTAKAAELQLQYTKEKNALDAKGLELNNQIMDVYDKAGSAQEAILNGIKEQQKAAYKDTPEAMYLGAAQDLLGSAKKAGGITSKQEMLINAKIMSKEIAPSQITTLFGMFEGKTTETQAVAEVITKFGGKMGGEMSNILNMLTNPENQSSILLAIKSAKTSEEAQRIIDFNNELVRQGGIISADLLVKYYADPANAAAKEKLDKILLGIDDAKDIDVPLVYKLNPILEDDPKEINDAFDEKYFKSLKDEATQKQYTKTINALVTVDPNVVVNDEKFIAWLSEDQMMGTERYGGVEWGGMSALKNNRHSVGFLVNEYIKDQGMKTTQTGAVDTTNAPDANQTTTTGGGSRNTYLDDLLKKLKFVQNSLVNTKATLKDLIKYANKPGFLNKLNGISNQLLNMGGPGGVNREMMSYLEGLDEKDRKKFLNIDKKGKVTFKKDAGEALRFAFDSKVLGEFNLAQQMIIKDSVAQEAAFKKLKALGIDSATALEMTADASNAVAINNNRISPDMLIQVAKNAKNAKDEMLGLDFAVEQTLSGLSKDNEELKKQAKVLEFLASKVPNMPKDVLKQLVDSKPILNRFYKDITDGTIQNSKQAEEALRLIFESKEYEVKVNAYLNNEEQISQQIQSAYDKASDAMGKYFTSKRATVTQSAANSFLQANASKLKGFAANAATGGNVYNQLKQFLTSQISAAQDSLKPFQSAVDTAQGKVDEAQAAVNVYENQISDLQNKIDQATARISAKYDAAIEDAKAKLEADTKAITDLYDPQIEASRKIVETLQRRIEVEFTRPIEELNKQIEGIQRGIEINLERPIAALQKESSDLGNDLTLMDKIAEGINQKYDAQAEALEKVKNINEEILNQQKDRLSVAEALRSGDASAAARAINEARNAATQRAQERASGTLEAARKAELAGIKSTSGMTRAQIEERQFVISQQILKLEQQKEIQMAKVTAIQDDIYQKQQAQLALQSQIQIEEDKIYKLEQARQSAMDGLKSQTDAIAKLEASRAKEMESVAKFEREIAQIRGSAGYQQAQNQLRTAQADLEAAQKRLALEEKKVKALQTLLDELEAAVANALKDTDAQEAAWEDVKSKIDAAASSVTDFAKLIGDASKAADDLAKEMGKALSLGTSTVTDATFTDASKGIFGSTTTKVNPADALEPTMTKAQLTASKGGYVSGASTTAIQNLAKDLATATTSAVGLNTNITKATTSAVALSTSLSSSATSASVVSLAIEKVQNLVSLSVADQEKITAAIKSQAEQMGIIVPLSTTFKNDTKATSDTLTTMSNTANTVLGIFNSILNTAKSIYTTILSWNTTVTTIHNIVENVTRNITEYVTRIVSEVSDPGVKKMYGGFIKPMSRGGMVMSALDDTKIPTYFARGGRVGSDTVPAMLTPGEYVVNKGAAKQFAPFLSAINESKYPSILANKFRQMGADVSNSFNRPVYSISSPMQSSFIQPSYNVSNSSASVSPTSTMMASVNDNSSAVYNYNLGITVGGTNASPQNIASAVMNEIKYLDSQRVKKQRVS